MKNRIFGDNRRQQDISSLPAAIPVVGVEEASSTLLIKRKANTNNASKRQKLSNVSNLKDNDEPKAKAQDGYSMRLRRRK